jgi:hypothetical protein
MCKQAANGFVWPVVQKNGLDHTFAMVASDGRLRPRRYDAAARCPTHFFNRFRTIDFIKVIGLRTSLLEPILAEGTPVCHRHGPGQQRSLKPFDFGIKQPLVLMELRIARARAAASYRASGLVLWHILTIVGRIVDGRTVCHKNW